MKLTIYRGTNEVGGNCFELTAGSDRVLFDLGLPLSSIDEKRPTMDYKLNIPGLYKTDVPTVRAIFISHAHPDHYGLLELIHPDIPVYMSPTTKDILLKVAPLLGDFDISQLHLVEIKEGDEIKIGGFSITAHAVDHSAAGSLGFEVESNGIRVAYTGDIRFHGRTSYLSTRFATAIQNTDYLIMEGSTLSRSDQKKITETDVEKTLSDLFKNVKTSIISFSAQNLDRFVSVYKACLRAKKTLVIDPYSAYLLELFKPISQNIPQFDWNNIRIYFPQNSINCKLADQKTLYKYKSKKISIDEILAAPEQFVIKDNFKITEKLLPHFSKDAVQIIHSMWAGYLDKANKWNEYDVLCVHASGHAAQKDLQSFVEKVNPKNIVPIHTECKKLYADLFGKKVLILEDGQEADLPSYGQD